MKKTKSYTYLLPMLAEHLKFKPQIVNVFLSDEKYPEHEGRIFVLYKYRGTKEFINYEEDLRSHPMYITAYDPDKYHVMIVLKVPAPHRLNYIRFKNSEYSKISNGYKQKILDFHHVSDSHPLYHVLYKTEEAFLSLEHDIGQKVPRNQEAGTLVDMDLETYTSSLKVVDAISPRTEAKPKPFRFNTKGGH